MEKIDFKKSQKEFYTAKLNPQMLDVPSMKYLMIDGAGNPGKSPDYSASVGALFGIAYTLKFMIKKSSGVDYAVGPLEGLWWMDRMEEFSMDRKDDWKWTMMIRQPDFIKKEDFKTALDLFFKKKDANHDFGMLVRFEEYEEGNSAQVLHNGPYDNEPPVIAGLHDFIKGKGFSLRGKHHEIYMGDPRRADPAKLKTVLRHPIRKLP